MRIYRYLYNRTNCLYIYLNPSPAERDDQAFAAEEAVKCRASEWPTYVKHGSYMI